MEVTTVPCGGVRVAAHVVRRGPRTPLLLLHGYGASHHVWLETASRLELARDVVAMDLRGHGESGWAPDGDYSVTALASDIAAAVRHFGWPRFATAGHSAGGMAALAHAVTASHRPASLALLDVDPFRFKDGLERLLPYRGPESAPSLPELARAVAASGDRRPMRTIESSLPALVRQLPNGWWTWRQDPRLRPLRGRIPARPLAGDAVAATLRSLAVPTLLLRGARSGATTHEGALRAATLMERASPEYVAIDGAGHDLLAGAAGEVARAIDRFLGAFDGTAS